TVVRLADGRLVLFGAVALKPQEQRALERFGAPAYLVIPSASYCEQARQVKARFPELSVIAPAGVKEKLEPLLRVDDTSVEFDDASVRLVAIPGTAGSEVALLVETAAGLALVVHELISYLSEDGERDADC
ncbi:MAG TPA: hypothetical protein VHW01_26145, partial [Polyangiaceae bacterium]|nr:hypothetical protein [Polyangiaceae bacterium]